MPAASAHREGRDHRAVQFAQPVEQPLLRRAEAQLAERDRGRLDLRLLAHRVAGIPGVLVRRFQALADNIVPLLSNKIRRTIQAGNRL